MEVWLRLGNVLGDSRHWKEIAYNVMLRSGLDAIGRVWDMRTGRSSMTLEGHMKDILGLDWSPNGYHLASASADNTVKIWDVRTLRNLYTISAHQSLVSDVKYSKGVPGTNNNSASDPHNIAGLYLTTSGYDGCVKIWSGDDFRLVKSLDGHDGKVMGVDVSRGKWSWRYVVKGQTDFFLFR